jgi:hypothetical protein
MDMGESLAGFRVRRQMYGTLDIDKQTRHIDMVT